MTNYENAKAATNGHIKAYRDKVAELITKAPKFEGDLELARELGQIWSIGLTGRDPLPQWIG